MRVARSRDTFKLLGAAIIISGKAKARTRPLS